MDATETTDVDRQTEIEARAETLALDGLAPTATWAEAYGPIEKWILTLPPHRFLLMPPSREWWWFDPIHGSWTATGHHADEVRFVVDGERLQVVPRAPTAVATPEPTPPKTS